jgi:hypothetical protein
MKYTLLLFVIGIITLTIPMHYTNPNFNGTNPGCEGGSCHTLQDGKVIATVTDLQVSITVTGTTNSVAGELVDSSGTVIAFNNSTGNNPFTLTAPGPGVYRVNAGHKSPLRWDSTIVSISVTNVGDDANGVLSSYKLFNNYPNPFNPSTIIRYSIPETAFTLINIYDALGNQVASLVNETKPAGAYEVEFNAEGLSSGIYYYTFQAGSFKEAKKMILLR